MKCSRNELLGERHFDRRAAATPATPFARRDRSLQLYRLVAGAHPPRHGRAERGEIIAAAMQ